MTDDERYQKYIREQCINCANKDTDLCEIRVSRINDITTTKCVYYKNTKPRKKIIPAYFQGW